MTQHGKDTDSVANLVRPTSKKQRLLQSTSKIVIGAMERVFYRDDNKELSKVACARLKNI